MELGCDNDYSRDIPICAQQTMNGLEVFITHLRQVFKGLVY